MSRVGERCWKQKKKRIGEEEEVTVVHGRDCLFLMHRDVLIRDFGISRH